ncbi:MAG TPA: hypothetical protein VJM69_00495 [Dehalococcoidia bacterium]|nr:hypothetical protein [Dehalococcoidia bacterium]
MANRKLQTTAKKTTMVALSLILLLILLATILVAGPSLSSAANHRALVSPVNQQQVGIDLGQGWNLISIPVSPSSRAPASAFASIAGKLRSAWTYHGGTWLTYFPGGPAGLNTLTGVDETMGIWLEMISAGTLTVQGSSPASAQIPIAEGWALVGFPAADAMPVEVAMASLGGGYSSVWGYRAGQWIHYEPGGLVGASSAGSSSVGSLDSLVPTEGYWIQATRSGTLAVNNHASPPPGGTGVIAPGLSAFTIDGKGVTARDRLVAGVSSRPLFQGRLLPGRGPARLVVPEASLDLDVRVMEETGTLTIRTPRDLDPGTYTLLLDGQKVATFAVRGGADQGGDAGDRSLLLFVIAIVVAGVAGVSAFLYRYSAFRQRS